MSESFDVPAGCKGYDFWRKLFSNSTKCKQIKEKWNVISQSLLTITTKIIDSFLLVWWRNSGIPLLHKMKILHVFLCCFSQLDVYSCSFYKVCSLLFCCFGFFYNQPMFALLFSPEDEQPSQICVGKYSRKWNLWPTAQYHDDDSYHLRQGHGFYCILFDFSLL